MIKVLPSVIQIVYYLPNRVDCCTILVFCKRIINSLLKLLEMAPTNLNRGTPENKNKNEKEINKTIHILIINLLHKQCT